ncbi:23S rRNA (guanine745-N1)-methyltransferase [Hypnocyclicus thermotrophus]|uniref:23S rRNA (Guanine745-N1)-methyltransferase n=1 Tax=Hypnocyclicus thermotrophus TaxID=1627895 RepID=A0AA46DYR8_9FUSO|nr:methyltransferase domain-containing protein [Hypnocyclicus thermotrophus]TDT70586.1 23S rRNA (guanine745-N1)-methyltransferase [Hypnocyclicus thermotrophus]
MFICPICNQKIDKIDKSYKCKNNHTFDMAKSGYLNLLISNKKRSKTPGDDKEMVIARRNFLNTDIYEEISKSVNEIILKLTNNKKMKIIDIGCGEGYYTSKIKEKIPNSEICGIDISKEAINLAAKTYKNINWVVASALNLPFLDNSIDISLVMFSRFIPEENFRLLSKNGYLIVVSTDDMHLIELKKVLYDKVKIESVDIVDEAKDYFIHKETKKVNYNKKLTSNQEIMNLFNMTPYKWKTKKEAVKRLEKINELEITIDVKIDIFQKMEKK